MTGAELAKRFGEFSKQSENFPFLEAGADPSAVLYGLDECFVDIHAKTVTLPDHGTVPVPTLDRVEGAEWFATITYPGKGTAFAIGLGDPYTPGKANPLPTKNGVIAAVPYRVIHATNQSTNRSQRRSIMSALMGMVKRR
ncbi:hypothetical protein ABIC83_002587 [Roseateles asaccharophilus]|uniref:hypothetical protein n=1 Tax=Roseateles asaccharophilus TaxID=582607 RepID=UPI0038362C4F